MRPRWSRIAALVSTLAVVLGMTACSSQPTATNCSIYNAQHESLTKEWIDAFTKETGIKVTYRQGGDTELGNQLVAEGDASPADVFLTENSPAMAAVEKAGLFADLDADTLDQVPAQYRPATGKWTGVAARSTVFVYNKTRLQPDQLPKSMLDLQQPAVEGPLGWGPAKADFQAIVSALLQLKGEQATAQWLAGMKANAKIYNDNIATMKAVNAGEVDGGIIYHYYWFRDQAKTKEGSGNTALHYFKNQDPGRVRQPVRRRRAQVQQEGRAGAAVHQVRHRQGRAGSAREGHLVRVPGGQRRSRESGPAAAGFAAGAQGRPVDAGCPEGGGSDDEGGLL